MNTKLNHIQNWAELARQANWSVSKLAKICDVSVRTLERRFLKQTGKHPKKWLIDQRQKQAVRLLRTGVYVKEVASQLGFKYAHHLSREFNRFWSHYPTAIEVARQRRA